MFLVLIDTSAYEALRLSFKGDIFEALKKLSSHQKILVVGSDILLKEMEAHLSEAISQSVNKMNKVSNDIGRLVQGDLGMITELLSDTSKLKEDIKAERLNRMNDFFASINYEEVDISKVNNKKIINDYFNVTPPFGEGNKRKEFPDAFILNAFINEYKENLASTCLVSQDDDWEKFANSHPEIRFFKSIPEFIDFIHTEYDTVFMTTLREAIDGKKEMISKYLSDTIVDCEITIDDLWIDPEIEIYSESVKVHINDFNIISFESESIILEVKIKVDYDISMWASDETASFKDDETKTWVYFGRNQYFASIKKDASVEIEMSFDPHPTILVDTLEIYDSQLPDELFYIDEEQRFELVKHWNENDYDTI